MVRSKLKFLPHETLKFIELSKLITVILLASVWFLCAASISAKSPVPAPTPREAGEKAQTRTCTRGGEGGAHDGPASALVTTVNQAETSKGHEITAADSSKKGKPPPYDGLLTWFTGVLAVVAVLQLVSLVCQSRQSQKAFRISERAYVNVHQIRVIGGKVKPGVFPEIIVEYRNSGRTPAKNLWIVTGRHPSSKTMISEDLPKNGRINSGVGAWKGGPVGEILPPDLVRSRSTGPLLPPIFGALGYTETLGAEMVADINDRKAYLCVWVAIDYEDTFGVRHDSVEPFFYDPDSGDFRPAYSGFHQSA